MNWLQTIYQNISQHLLSGAVILAGFVLLFLVYQFLFKKWLSKLKYSLKEIVVPVRFLFPALRFLFVPICLLILIQFISLGDSFKNVLHQIVIIWFIVGVSWLIISLLYVLKEMVTSHYRVDVKDNLKARQVSTQLNVIYRVLVVIVVVIASALVLMTFDTIRQIGISILASAGIAGIIIGFAAQKSLATLIAGIQIAITQPIRIDDVVIVEGEWGWIEEITLTYVVVRIWDQRRLVVPITFFIEKPFQNWTRKTAELLGTVYIYGDYTTPVDDLRTELESIVNSTPLWDKRVAKIQVTNTTEKTMELRVLISAENSSNAWELRCLVRERLIAFMQKNYPNSLPKIRLEKENNPQIDKNN